MTRCCGRDPSVFGHATDCRKRPGPRQIPMWNGYELPPPVRDVQPPVIRSVRVRHRRRLLVRIRLWITS